MVANCHLQNRKKIIISHKHCTECVQVDFRPIQLGLHRPTQISPEQNFYSAVALMASPGLSAIKYTVIDNTSISANADRPRDAA